MKTNSLFLDATRASGSTSSNPKYCAPRLTVRERELDELKAGSIRVEMVQVGICGTDLHLVKTEKDGKTIECSAPFSIPSSGRVIGHEGYGKVIEVGSAVTGIALGDFVTFESLIACYRCDRCRRGQFNQCRHAKLLGLEEDGLFTLIADVPASLAHPINDLVGQGNPRALACVEPAAVAFLACQNAKVSPGERVAIFGGGPIGLYCAIAAKTLFGASEIHLVEPVRFRRALAEEWVDETWTPEDFFASSQHDLDVVFESSGHLANLTRSFPRINANGRAVILGRCGEPLVIEDSDHMITNAIQIMGSRGHLGGAFDDLLKLYRHGRFPLEAPVTETIEGLSQLKHYLERGVDILERNCKVLVRLNQG